MARPNYQQGKRQRELAKKQKREEKMKRRLEKKNEAAGPPVEGEPEKPAAPPEVKP